MLSAPLRRLAANGRKRGGGRATEQESLVWALRNVSLEVRRGEVLGMVGRNGSGKSTLLKILSRITEPTEGSATFRGRVAALLEVGTGFHPELTGRENIYLNGAILGMTRREIARKFDEIVDFSGVEPFLETPVKHYSSGMTVRLAFAVAAHLETDILLIDEVLAVGDAAFQQKCMGKIGSVARSGRTILFVSHNMAAIHRLCDRAIWLDQGQLRTDGHPSDVIATYLASDSTRTGEIHWTEGFADEGVTEFRLESLRVLGGIEGRPGQIDPHEPFTVAITYRILEPLPACRVGITLQSADGIVLFDGYDSDAEDHASRRLPGLYTSHCTVPGILLSPGRYFISVNAGIPNVRNLAYADSALAIDIVDVDAPGSHAGVGHSGILRPKLEWEQVVQPL
jgi:lipopolysaccharide transport system ATP-binding protein